jgi:hypothetical protein
MRSDSNINVATKRENGGGGMPRSSNDCINRESYGGHVLVEFCGKFTDLTLETAFSSKFVSGSTLPEFTYITTGLWRAVK